MFSQLQAVIAIAFSIELAHARLVSRPQDLTRRDYDYVIVGGGTAGSVLANRLTENHSTRVLVVEAGGSNDAPNAAFIQVPYFVSKASKTNFDWNYTTIPQTGFNNRSISYPRGHVLGGSSSTNYMFYTRGSSDDWDQLARISGDDGWSWKRILPYFIKSETVVAPADNHDTTGQVDPAVHGTDGPLKISLPGLSNALDSRVVAATQELKSEYPFNVDMNSGNPLGIGFLQSTIGNGTRSSAATAYLAPVLSRPNLDVLINTHATKLIQTGRQGSTPVFSEVQLTQGVNEPLYKVTAKKEILVTAGAIGTPKLLMLSGIGNAKDLKGVGIKALVNLPDVGNDLQDHPFIALPFSVNNNNTNDALNHNPALMEAATVQYNTAHQGPLANNPGGNNLGFLRLPKDSSALKGKRDPAAGPTSPHYEVTFGNSFLSFTQAPPTTGGFMTMLVAMVAATSRGNLKLASADPFAQPLINPNMLSESLDIQVLTEGVKAAKRFVAAPAWSEYIIAPFGDTANLTSDAAIQAYVRQFSSSFNHVGGSAKMASAYDNSGVVGPDLKVKGVKGLRVVDASILPFLPGAHLQAVVYAIAERAADLVKASH